MRITIETGEPANLAGQQPAATTQDVSIIDAGAGAIFARAGEMTSTRSDVGTDAGGPPAWLLAAIGATKAASEAAAGSQGQGDGGNSDSNFADAGPGPNLADR